VAEYRRVTRQCAADDWPQCRTHEDVVDRHGGTDLIKQFLGQDPRIWYSGKAPRERRRDLRPGQPAPGTRVIGQVKVAGFRAWVWQDDGTVYDIERGFAGFELHWMIAYGNRRRGHRSDLQEKRKALLHDPHDSWRPRGDDYADLLAAHDDGFTERNVAAIRRAVERAQHEHNTVIDIAAGEVTGHVVHEHDEDVVDGVVIEETNERWLLLAKERRGGRPLTFADAQILAAAAYPDHIYPETVMQRYDIRGGLHVADPATHFVFYAELT
jgi:hypothetical protein